MTSLAVLDSYYKIFPASPAHMLTPSYLSVLATSCGSAGLVGAELTIQLRESSRDDQV